MHTPFPPTLKLLAHEVRWQLLRALALSDYRVQELVARVERPQNLVSYHLRALRDGGLVQEHRSSADGRDVYYSLNLTTLRHAYATSGASLHPALVSGLVDESPTLSALDLPPIRVLFLCTHNSARSLLAEALLRQYAGGQVEGASAGNQPTTPHPLTRAMLEERGIDPAPYQSKDVAFFEGQRFDYTITVCDRVRESCPIFPHATSIHWSLPDPASQPADLAAQRAAFEQTVRALNDRIPYFLQWVRTHPPEQP